MSFMDRAFARLYPKIINSSEKKWLREARRALLAEARGDVVEIGAGTGLNLEHYGPGVTSLTVTEASAFMLPQLKRNVAAKRPDARVLQAPGESLPLEDNSADYVVSTLVLCTAPQEATLREVRRILRPNGVFLLLEHVVGKGGVAKMQRYAEPVTRFFGRGCHVTRNTRAALEAAGFDTSQVTDERVDSEPKIYAPHVVGRAVHRTGSVARGGAS